MYQKGMVSLTKMQIQRSAFNDLVSRLFFFYCLKSGKFIVFIKRLIEINLQKKILASKVRCKYLSMLWVGKEQEP